MNLKRARDVNNHITHTIFIVNGRWMFHTFYDVPAIAKIMLWQRYQRNNSYETESNTNSLPFLASPGIGVISPRNQFRFPRGRFSSIDRRPWQLNQPLSREWELPSCDWPYANQFGILHRKRLLPPPGPIKQGMEHPLGN